MESQSSHDSDLGLYAALAWFEKNKKPVIIGGVAVLAVVLITLFVVEQKKARQQSASAAFSRAFVAQLLTGITNATPEFEKVAKEHAGSDAARRAELVLAGTLFSQGRYADAQTAFEKFVRDHGATPVGPQGLLGIAACLEALGKTSEALKAYEDVKNRHANENVAVPARFAIARLYSAQNKNKEALAIYEDLFRSHQGTSIGSESGILAEEIKAKYPELVPPPIIPTNLPSATPTTPILRPSPGTSAPAANTNTGKKK